MEYVEVRFGMLMMVLCDREGRVYDVWITFGSVHEVRAFRERKKRSFLFIFIYSSVACRSDNIGVEVESNKCMW